MSTIVMGGGLIGVASAYYLARKGEEVCVIEQNRGPGEETSFQNGALLAPGHSHSWAAPGAVWTLLKSLFQRDPALKFRFSTDPQFWRWAIQFLGSCNQRDYTQNTLRVYRCMHQGLDELRDLCRETGLEFDGNDNGILYLFRSKQSFERRAEDWTLLRDNGLRLEQVDVERCIDIEPTLTPAASRIAGGFFSPEEGAGDAYQFTLGLAEHCKQLGVRFEYANRVINIDVNRRRIQKVITSDGIREADSYLLTLGPNAPVLARSIGLELPIWPIKGYTVSIPVTSDAQAPTTGIIEEDNLVAFARLGDRLRIGGKAEFAGYDRSYVPADFRGVLNVARDLFPDGGDYANPSYWACLRPVSAGGPPILGNSPITNLYLNVGHGAAGWTMGCATARAVADIMAGEQPTLDMQGLTL